MNTLKSIKNIVLTEGEVDVIACIMNTRGVKKISAILEISHFAFESHLKNIFIKFSCNSEDAVEAIVEISDEMTWLRNHYVELLGLYYLRQQLEHMAEEIGKVEIESYIPEEDKEALSEVVRYLQMAKVSVSNEKTAHNSNQEIRLLTQKDVLILEEKQSLQEAIYICQDPNLLEAVKKFEGIRIFDATSQKAFAMTIFKTLVCISPDEETIQYIAIQASEFDKLQKHIVTLKPRPYEEDDSSILQKSYKNKFIIFSILVVWLLAGALMYRLSI